MGITIRGKNILKDSWVGVKKNSRWRNTDIKVIVLDHDCECVFKGVIFSYDQTTHFLRKEIQQVGDVSVCWEGLQSDLSIGQNHFRIKSLFARCHLSSFRRGIIVLW